jgi:hypothetical protein
MQRTRISFLMPGYPGAPKRAKVTLRRPIWRDKRRRRCRAKSRHRKPVVIRYQMPTHGIRLEAELWRCRYTCCTSIAKVRVPGLGSLCAPHNGDGLCDTLAGRLSHQGPRGVGVCCFVHARGTSDRRTWRRGGHLCRRGQPPPAHTAPAGADSPRRRRHPRRRHRATAQRRASERVSPEQRHRVQHAHPL